METFEQFLNYLEKEGIDQFQSKSLSELLSKQFLIPKSRIIVFCRKMLDLKMIERRSVGGNCQTICASCYEYGCTEPNRPPLNYWKVLTFKQL